MTMVRRLNPRRGRDAGADGAYDAQGSGHEVRLMNRLVFFEHPWRAWAMVAVLGAAVGAGVSRAQTTQPASIDQLIAQLSADSWLRRQLAQDMLVEMGSAAVARLERELARPQADEVRTRIEAALRQIEANELTGPSLITLHARGAAPAEVFAEVARQAKTSLRPSPPNLWEKPSWRALDVDFNRVPFWAAMQELCLRTGLTLLPQMGGEILVAGRPTASDGPAARSSLAGRAFTGAPASIHGPFLITATHITRSSVVDLAQPRQLPRTCDVFFLAHAEPKLRVLLAQNEVEIEEAVDESGRSLAAQEASGQGIQTGVSGFWNLRTSLLPQPQSQRVAVLRGKARFLIQTRSDQAVIEDVMAARNVERSAAGKRFVLKEARRVGDGYEVILTLYRAGFHPSEWNLFLPQYGFRLLDEQHEALLLSGVATRGGAEQADFTLRFQRRSWSGSDAAGEPRSLVWEVPVETREVVVPFEFRDLPLP